MAAIKQLANELSCKADAVLIIKMLGDIQTDLAAIRTAHNAAMAKLDADAGVTDTNYAALNNIAAQQTQP